MSISDFAVLIFVIAVVWNYGWLAYEAGHATIHEE